MTLVRNVLSVILGYAVWTVIFLGGSVGIKNCAPMCLTTVVSPAIFDLDDVSGFELRGFDLCWFRYGKSGRHTENCLYLATSAVFAGNRHPRPAERLERSAIVVQPGFPDHAHTHDDCRCRNCDAVTQ